MITILGEEFNTTVLHTGTVMLVKGDRAICVGADYTVGFTQGLVNDVLHSAVEAVVPFMETDEYKRQRLEARYLWLHQRVKALSDELDLAEAEMREVTYALHGM